MAGFLVLHFSFLAAVSLFASRIEEAGTHFLTTHFNYSVFKMLYYCNYLKDMVICGLALKL